MAILSAHIRHIDTLASVEGAGFVPSHAAPDAKGGAIFAHHILRVVCKFFHEDWNRPFRAAERPLQTCLKLVCKLSVSDCITRQENDLVADGRLKENDFGREHANVVRRRHSDSRVVTSQGINGVILQVDDTELRLEEVAHEHAGGNDDPFGLCLGAQDFAHIELSVEDILWPATANGLENRRRTAKGK